MIYLEKVAFVLFGQEIYYYGIIMAGAILVCLIVATILCKAKKINTDLPFEIFLAVVPAGILSARLFSCIFEEGLTLADYFNFRSGGMSIFGAIIGGAIGMVVYKLIKKQPFLKIADIATSVLLLGQSIGRWGNYFNEEVFGQEILDSGLQFFPYAVQIDGAWYEALFFWESVLTLIGFVAILIIYLKTKDEGWATGSYLLYYGVVRAILEPHRQAEYILKLGSIPISGLVSWLFIATGVAILTIKIVVIVKKKEKNCGGKTIHG